MTLLTLALAMTSSAVSTSTSTRLPRLDPGVVVLEPEVTTSTTPEFVDQPNLEAKPKVKRHKTIQDLYREVPFLEEEMRFGTDRRLRFALGLRFGIRLGNERARVSSLLALGLQKRLLRFLVLQAQIAGGAAEAPGREPKERTVDSHADVTLRFGVRRFFFGFGAYGKVWWTYVHARRFSPGEWLPVQFGAGSLLELGGLLLKDRNLEILVRVYGGLQRGLTPHGGAAVGVGWVF